MRGADLTRCRPGRGGDAGESFQELVKGGLPVVDGGAHVAGEGDVREHLLEVVLRLQQLAFAGVLRVQESQRARAVRCRHCSQNV